MGSLSENTLIVLLRSVVFHLCSGAVTLVFLIFLPLVWAPLRIGWPVWRGYVRAQLWLLRMICGQSFHIDAREVLDQPVILASRHEALWESFVLPIVFDNPVMFSKDDVERYPVAGMISRKFGYIPLDRSGSAERTQDAFRTARTRSGEGRSFLIFPSGTRDPRYRFRVQKGVAVLYRMLGVPCVPIVLDSGRYWPHKSLMRRPGEIKVRVLPAIPAGLRTSQFLERLKADLASPV